jgi:hypothetical protein
VDAALAPAAPDWTLQQIAAQLEAMRERAPRGGTRWHRSSVQQLLAKTERLRLNQMAGGPAQKSHCETMRLLSRMNKEK